MQMWNNPDCSKCAAARETLAGLGIPVTLRRYLDDPPTPAELADVLDRLKAEPWDICRLGEPVAETLGLAAWARDVSTRQDWIDTMADHPVLIQRPIIIRDDGSAIVARTPEALERLFP